MSLRAAVRGGPRRSLGQAKFTLFRRRHHCRTCGKLICGSCSDFRVLRYQDGTGSSEKQKRVCRACFLKLKGQRVVDIRAKRPSGASLASTIASGS